MEQSEVKVRKGEVQNQRKAIIQNLEASDARINAGLLPTRLSWAADVNPQKNFVILNPRFTRSGPGNPVG